MTIDNSKPPFPDPIPLPMPGIEEADLEIPIPVEALMAGPGSESSLSKPLGELAAPFLPLQDDSTRGDSTPAPIIIPAEVDDVPSEEELVISRLPAWLASIVLHLSALIIVALIVFPVPKEKTLMVDAVFADRIGEQLDSDVLELSSPDAFDVKTPELATSGDVMVEDPFATPPNLPVTLDRGMLTGDLPSANVGIAYLGRTEGMKKSLLRAYGGTALTEEAVANALEWLRRNQRGYGDWSLRGPYADGATIENNMAATAMAMMAFEGAGHTHKIGRYKAEMDRALRWLLRSQHRNGSFYRGDSRNHRPYTEAMAMIALCELYGMTKDETLLDPAQRAVNYAVKSQGIEGGWRYEPRSDSDTSVTGWYLMGLQSARAAGLDVPSEVFERIQKYLDLAAVDEGSRYSYIPGTFETPSMTAEGLLCRQFLGWRPDDPRMQRGVDYIMANPMDWSLRDSYYWYYATQTLFHLGGYPWEEWNRQLRVILPERQEKIGDERGSWTNHGDRWGSAGGRLFVTCLSTYMLEVYYRRMPLYSPVYGRESDPPLRPVKKQAVPAETATTK